ncbi:tRNA pseudouridine(55) synthase TruB [Chlamydiota bacterium]
MDGIILLDKPTGVTSFHVVSVIKRRFGFKKVGHAGTLDPFATGLLLILINDGTKLFDCVVTTDKEYSGVMFFGAQTDSQDRTGSIVSEVTDFSYSRDVLELVRCEMIGTQMQTPPMRSALHYNGKRLYQLARKGIQVAVPPREITIYDLQFKDFSFPLVAFRIHCSKGTYVRTVCHDMGIKVGCGAYLKELKRDSCGPFCIEEALLLDDCLASSIELLAGKILSPTKVKEMLEHYAENTVGKK